MIHFTTRQSTTLALLAALMWLVLTACRPDLTQGSPVGGTQTPTEPSPGELTFGSGPFALVDPAAGLAALPRYRATLVLSFEGTRGGQAERWSRMYTMLASQEPAAHQLSIETTGQISGGVPASVLMTEMNGVRYERQGQDSCRVAAVIEGRSLAEEWEPAAFLPLVFGADEAGDETVNGMVTHHYTFDQQALGLGGIAEAAGEVWVASEGGYAAKYVLSIQGGEDYFGDSTMGTVTWEYSLSESGQPFTVEMPEDCPSGLVDAPLLDDAKDVHWLSGVTIFSTSASIADVIAFYQEQLPAQGWAANGEPMLQETMGIAEFTLGEVGAAQHGLSVIATPGDGVTLVRLVLGSALTAEMAETLIPTP